MNAKRIPLSGRAFLRPLTAVIAVGIGFGASCSDQPKVSPTELKGRVVIKGSNTFGEELAPRLIAAYRRSRPNVSVELESKGSGSGLTALLAGECDIASASRNLTAEETTKFQDRGIQVQEYIIGYYGVAVVVSASNPVVRLTQDQVRDIFTGKAKNWKSVGGSDAVIHVYTRDPVSGTNLGFRELAMENKPYVADAKSFTSYSELAQAVAQDPGGIGYSSMHLAKLAGVRAVRIGNTDPNEVSVNEGWYPYARALRLYTNKSAESPAARDVARFIQGKEGQGIISETGFVKRFEKKLNSLVPD